MERLGETVGQGVALALVVMGVVWAIRRARDSQPEFAARSGAPR